MNIKLMATITIFAFTICILYLIPNSNAETTTIYPDEDSYVYGITPTTNYGTKTTFAMNSWSSPYTYISYIKDAYSNIGTDPTNITLYIYLDSGTVGYSLNAYTITSTWEESTINFNNKPTISAEIASTVIVSGWNSIIIPISQYTNSNFQNYGIALYTNITGGISHFFRSSDYASTTYDPYVVYEYEPQPVEIQTKEATNITRTAATLNGELTILDINESYVNCFFQYGLSTAYGTNTTPATNLTANGTFSANITGLSLGNTYHFRAIGIGENNTYYGDDFTFNTNTTIYLKYEYNNTLVPSDISNGTNIEIQYTNKAIQHLIMDSNPYTFAPLASEIYRVVAYWDEIYRSIANTDIGNLIITYVPSLNDSIVEYEFFIIDNTGSLDPETTFLEIYTYDINGSEQIIHQDWLSSSLTCSAYLIRDHQYRTRIVDATTDTEYNIGLIVADGQQTKYLVIGQFAQPDVYWQQTTLNATRNGNQIYAYLSSIFTVDELTITLYESQKGGSIILLPEYFFTNTASETVSFTIDSTKSYIVGFNISDDVFGEMTQYRNLNAGAASTAIGFYLDFTSTHFPELQDGEGVGIAIAVILFIILMAAQPAHTGIIIAIDGGIFAIVSYLLNLSDTSYAIAAFIIFVGLIELVIQRRNQP